MRKTTTLSAALLALTLAPAAEAYQFTTYDHPLAAGITYTLSINNQRDIGGAYNTPDGLFHGYVVIGGVLQNIDVPGALQTVCGSVGDDGLVTGTYADATFAQHGFHFKDGVFTTIDVPGAVPNYDIIFEFGPGLGTAAYRTNANGLVIGQYADADGFAHGYTLDSSDNLTTLDFPGSFHIPGHDTTAIAVNDHGLVGGSYTSGAPPFVHGFLFRDGQYFPFDVPFAGGSFGTQINGMNNAGTLVGPYTDANDFLHGFVYSSGQFTSVDVPGALFTEVDGINDHGHIVGEWYGFDGVIHGFIGR